MRECPDCGLAYSGDVDDHVCPDVDDLPTRMTISPRTPARKSGAAPKMGQRTKSWTTTQSGTTRTMTTNARVNAA